MDKENKKCTILVKVYLQFNRSKDRTKSSPLFISGLNKECPSNFSDIDR